MTTRRNEVVILTMVIIGLIAAGYLIFRPFWAIAMTIILVTNWTWLSIRQRLVLITGSSILLIVMLLGLL